MTPPEVQGKSGVTRTPPQIVVAAPLRTRALAAFIAQELEQWGFGVELDVDKLLVNADGREVVVNVVLPG